jgi:drug/metabolite transporter (DMT)-like permease
MEDPVVDQGVEARGLCGLLLFVLGAAWGLQLTLLKGTAEASLSELSILSISLVLLAGGFGAALSLRRLWFRPKTSHVRFFVISGLFGYVVPLGGVLLIAERLAAGLIVLYTEALVPVFTILIAVMLRTERLTSTRAAAIVLALSGVAIALWPELMLSADARLEWLLLVLVIPAAYAIDGIYVSANWPKDLNALQVVTGEAAAGTVMLVPLWIITEGGAPIPASMGPGEWAMLGFVLVSYLEVYLYFHLLKTSGAVLVSYGCFISLLSGFVWGMVLLEEQYRASITFAVVLVVAGLYLIVTRREATAAAEA